jgi:hypothetical protein
MCKFNNDIYYINQPCKISKSLKMKKKSKKMKKKRKFLKMRLKLQVEEQEEVDPLFQTLNT